jgi:tRNA (guanine37-N1)-methyltransferase
MGMAVPDVLLKGNHADIVDWRNEESIKITVKNRPDLLED